MALATTLTACTTTGRSFDSSQMHLIVPGQTTIEQASQILKAEPENVYRQRDGAATARWASKASVVADAVYFRRELSLSFDNAGRFVRVVDKLNVPGETGVAPQAYVAPAPRVDAVQQSLPRSVPTGFPYNGATFDGPVEVHPVR